MNEAIETIEYRGFEINIYQDENPEDPREWDNLGTMTCFHNRYNLGDKHDFNSPEEMWISLAGELCHYFDDNLEGITIEEVKEIVCKDFVVLPLYLYDHSGITMSTRPFSCPWDSGQVGIIYASNEKAEKETEDYKGNPNIVDILTGEVETYNKFISGEVCGYNIEPTHRNKSIECDGSCSGFYDYDHMVSEAKEAIDYSIKEYKEEMTKQHKERMATALFLRTCWAD